MIRVSCEFRVPIGRTGLEHYIRSLEISVLGWDESGNDYVMGKVGGDMLLLQDAQMDGVSIFDICDQDSQGMYELYEALFAENQFQEELDVDDVTNHILFLWRSVFHPKLRLYQQPIVQVLCEMFGLECVTIMWRNFTDLADKELADLGFRKIAGTDFVFRHVAFATRFGDQNPQGVDTPLEFIASEEDEDWVLDRWEKDGDEDEVAPVAIEIPADRQRELLATAWQTSCEQVKSQAQYMHGQPLAVELADEIVRDFLAQPVPTTAAEMNDGLKSVLFATAWLAHCSNAAADCLMRPSRAERTFGELRTQYRESRE